MLKKIFAASVIATLTTGVAVANPAPYIGAGIGVTANTANTSALGGDFGIGSFRGMPFNVFAGYGGVVSQNLYLAGELFGTVATANLSSNDELKTNYTYGAAILPGIMLSDHTLAYVRAGILQSRFTQLASKNNLRTGGQFGFGLQTSLTQHVDLRGEYDFVAYQSINGRSAIYKIPYTTSPRSDQFNLGLVYKFD